VSLRPIAVGALTISRAWSRCGRLSSRTYIAQIAAAWVVVGWGGSLGNHRIVMVPKPKILRIIRLCR